MTRTEGKAEGEGRIGSSFYEESSYFDRATHLKDFDSRFQRYRVRMVASLHPLRATDRVLDLGCGWGTVSLAVAPGVKEVIGLDFAERAIESCNARLRETGLGNVQFRVADARDTGLGPGEFDVVIAADLFEHLYPDDSESVAREAFRVTKPGGCFVVWTPSRSHFLEVLKNNDVLLKRDVSHVDYKSLDRMKELLQAAGFVLERAHYAPSHLPGLSLLERAGQRWIPLLRRRIAVVGRRPPIPEPASTHES